MFLAVYLVFSSWACTASFRWGYNTEEEKAHAKTVAGLTFLSREEDFLPFIETRLK